jgi:hypothetical protein
MTFGNAKACNSRVPVEREQAERSQRLRAQRTARRAAREPKVSQKARQVAGLETCQRLGTPWDSAARFLRDVDVAKRHRPTDTRSAVATGSRHRPGFGAVEGSFPLT